jgi:hypothetical protein
MTSDNGVIMVHMGSAVDISLAEREGIRLEFYRAHRAQSAFSSVAVRRDPVQGVWFLDVGATGPVNVATTYRGLQVRVKPALAAVNAVARREQVV